jgi:flavin reductase (DIM6/NTAB) family NADH-FMN oxidoreductase RutF
MNATKLESDEFRCVCSRFPTGVTVTTLNGDDRQPYGITLNSFTSVSANPCLVLVCVDNRSPILRHWRCGRYFAINVLSEEQRELSIRFARNWNERFNGVSWRPGVTGVPILSDVAAVLECETVSLTPVGDHHVIIGHAVYGTWNDRLPLAYLHSAYRRFSCDAQILTQRERTANHAGS